MHGHKIERSRSRKQLKRALVSIAVLDAGGAAARVYCTVDAVCHVRPEELASQLVMHSALPSMSCHLEVVCHVSYELS